MIQIPDYSDHLIPSMRTLPEDLESVFNVFHNSPKTFVRRLAKRGFVYNLVRKKRALFLGVHHFPEGMPQQMVEVDPIVYPHGAQRKYIEEIALRTGLKDQWTYLNLLFIHIKEDQNVLTLLNSREGISFLTRQLQISMRLIEELKPEIIFVIDPLAVRFFRANTYAVEDPWMGYVCPFDKRFGVHVIQNLNQGSLKRGEKFTVLKGIPVIFFDESEPMPPYAFQRLLWQVRQVMTVYEWYFGPDHVDGLGKILSSFHEMAKDVDEWSKLKTFYVARQDYIASVRERDRINDHLDKIQLVLLNLFR